MEDVMHKQKNHQMKPDINKSESKSGSIGYIHTI